jgi:aldehyde reductase
MEKLVEAGLTKGIGLSNFNSKQVDRVWEIAQIKPAINQFECHPYLNQKRLIEHCTAKGIVITAYGALGSPDRPWAKPEEPALIHDPKVLAIGEKFNKTAAQVLIKYQIQKGNSVIPKSFNKERLKINFDVFNFEMSQEDMDLLDTFDCNGRFFPHPE